MIPSETKTYREKLTNIFIRALKEDKLGWKRGWDKPGSMKPKNAATGGFYKGINRLYLWMAAKFEEYEDPRWATFNQIKQEGWSLKKGSKGEKVEYWMPFDKMEKKYISWSEYGRLSEKEKETVSLRVRYYTVFNGCDILGIPPMPEPVKHDINSSELIHKISVGMNVDILHDSTEGRAYYSIREDKIHLPEIAAFHSDYEYNATALHELAHSTGAEGRLNRIKPAAFGTEPYAYEELVAEITSCFTCEELKFEMSSSHMDNHKAYVQGWITGLEEKPEALINAIRDAERAADYLGYYAGLIPQKGFEKVQQSSMEIKEEARSVEKETRMINPELRKKLQEMENAGVCFSITKNGVLRIPAQAKASLTKNERDDLSNYLKLLLEENKITVQQGSMAKLSVFTELCR